LQDHAKTIEYRKLAWAKLKGKKSLQKVGATENYIYGKALLSFFKAAYFMDKETIPFRKFPTLCNSLVSCNAPMIEKLYHDEKACNDMVFGIFLEEGLPLTCLLELLWIFYGKEDRF
jgi:hypothetical protein